MIDFRYHLVSIVAVFLALAIGIVVGSTALKPAVLSGLQKTATRRRSGSTRCTRRTASSRTSWGRPRRTPRRVSTWR